MPTAPRTPLLPTSLLLATALACGAGTSQTTDDGATDSTGAPPAGDTGTAAPGSSSSGGDDTPTGATAPGTSTGDPTTTSAGSTTTDATTADATTGDPVVETTGTTDGTTGTTTGGPADGLGELAGDCGLIDAMELESPDPFVFTNSIDFGAIGYDYDLLTPGGQQMKDEGGLNDGSLLSEVIAYEVLARCDMAALLKTEAEIVYTDPMGKKTDILVELDGHKVGVSVVRALGFPKEDPYTVAQAETILKKKLGDIQISSMNVAPEDAWIKQILSVIAYGPMHAESVQAAYAGLDPSLTADTILVITVTDGDDAFLY